MKWAPATLTLALLPGCPLAHVPPPDGGASDGGLDAPVLDAWARPDAGPDDEIELLRAIHDARCARAVRCRPPRAIRSAENPWLDEDPCRRFDPADERARLDAEGLRVDDAAAAGCLEQLGTPCATERAAPGDMYGADRCRGYLVRRAPAPIGSSCVEDRDCGPDAYCPGHLPHCDVCTRRPELGDPCDDRVCVESSTCFSVGGGAFECRECGLGPTISSRDYYLGCRAGFTCSDGVCNPPDGLGAGCVGTSDCPTGLVCTTTGCAIAPSAGAACGDDDRCASGWECSDEHLCRRPAQPGERCGASIPCSAPLSCVDGACVGGVGAQDGEPCDLLLGPVCAAGIRCDGAVCRAFAGAGESCVIQPCGASAPYCVRGTCADTVLGMECLPAFDPFDGDRDMPCPPGYRCGPETLECEPFVLPGDACDGATLCEEGMCVDGVCVALALPHASCETRTCLPGWLCRSAVCVPGPEVAEGCDASTPCASGTCVGGRCEWIVPGAVCESDRECEHGCYAGVCDVQVAEVGALCHGGAGGCTPPLLCLSDAAGEERCSDGCPD